MKLSAAAIALIALASPALVVAQDRTPEPPKAKPQKVVCSFCGADRDAKDEVCPFCGGKETSAPPREDGIKIAPAPVPPKPPEPPRAPDDNEKPPAIYGRDLKHKDPDATDEEGTEARARAYKDDNVAKGDYYFKTGYYLKASESYRVAVLAEPSNAWKKLAFGHALFAIGNYSYSSYALRRAVSQMDATKPFGQDVASLFPSKKAFEKAVKDLKRYVTYSPRDPAGLSVLGYMLFVQGEDDRAKEMFVYLQRLPKNDNDAFAAFFLKQIDARKGTTPEPTPPKPAVNPPPPQTPPPPAPKDGVMAPEGARQDEEPAKPKAAPAKALAE